MSNRKSLRSNGLAIAIILLVAIIGFTTSCKKKNDNTPSFAGTYNGTLTKTLYSEADTITISVSGSAAVMVSKTAAGSTYTINGTVSGTNMTIASQSVYIPSPSATYTVSGTATLNNSTLVINYVFVSATSSSSNWTFNGTKQ
jgi:hypothetical protein